MKHRRCPDCPAPDQPKVPGYGNRDHPPIMFVGESPGEQEVQEGRAFSPNGRSGQLLHQILRDLGVNPQDCYFDNICMCPSKGKPSAARVDACYDGLIDTIAAVRPRIIVPMGNVAAKTLGQYERGISTVRSEYRELNIGGGVKVGVLPTYHPAAILRSPDLFRDLVNDLERAIRIGSGAMKAVESPPYDQYTYVHNRRELEEAWPLLESAKLLSVDLETSSRDIFDGRILIIGLGYARGRAVTIDWKVFEDSEKWNRKLKDLLETKRCAFQTAGYDIAWLWVRDIRPRLVFDTEVAHWLLDERDRGHGLENMAIQYYNAPAYKSQFRRRNGLGAYIADEEQFGIKFTAIPQDDMMRYNGADADYTWRLAVDLRKALRKDEIPDSLMQLILDATELYTDFFIEGMWIDPDHKKYLKKKLKKEIREAEAVLMAMAPDVNPRSPAQLAKYLYDDLKLKPFGVEPVAGKEIPQDIISARVLERAGQDPEAELFWKTSRPALFGGTGSIDKGIGLSARSAGLFTLFWLRKESPYAEALIRYKHSLKRLRTYIGQIEKFTWADGRVRPDYRLVGNLHGRFRTSKPAIHNLPNEQDIYNLYMAPPGYVIVHADFKQADLRMLAHLSGDDNLVEWLKGDPHAEVVKVIRRITDEDLARIKEANPDEYKRSRLAAKTINFGLLYGRGAASLAPQLGITTKQAQVYMKRYWERLPDAAKWRESRYDELMANGQEYQSPFGNKRRFPLLVSRQHRWKAGSLGINFPIMSSVNYLTTLAHIRTVHKLRSMGIDTYVYPHIHDSINVCVPADRMLEAAKVMKEVMSAIPLEMGFDGVTWPVDVESGTHWGALEEVDLK